MDDLNEKLARLLSSPDGMEKIRSAMAAFGGDGEEAASSPSAAPPQPQPEPQSAPVAAAPFGGGAMPDPSLLLKIAPLIGAFSKDDDDTRLLQALRPYLHGERESRLEESVKLLKLTKLLPLLQTEGLLGGLLGGSKSSKGESAQEQHTSTVKGG